MKKKFLALVLTLAMVLSLVPATALAANGTQEGNNQGPVEVRGSDNDKNLTMKKTVTPVQNQDGTYQDGTYTVRLESYATGSVSTTQTPVPMDIVLVLDVSGSMGDKIASYDYRKTEETSWSVSDVYHDYYDWGGLHRTDVTYYAKIDDGYYPVSYHESGNWGSESYWLEANNKVLGRKVTNREWNQKIYAEPLYTYSKVPGTEITKLYAMKTAVNSFIDSVAAQKDGETPVAHRISIVKFSGEGKIVKELTDVSHSAELKSAVNSLKANGATAADYGMQKAQSVLKNRGDNPNPSIVIMFTDGEPNHGSGYRASVAGDTVQAAKGLKDGGTKVYTIGMFKDLQSFNADKVDTYMNGVSSNYPEAVEADNDSGVTLGERAEGNYYFKADNAGDLNQVFQTISQSTTVTSPLDASAVVVDNVPSNFALTEGSVKVYTENCIAKNGETFEWGTKTESTIRPTIDDQSISVTGFNFSKNWCGLDENNQACGQKLIIEFTISRTNYGGTQRTNAGAYIKANADSTDRIIWVDDPEVPVTVQLPDVSNPAPQTKAYKGAGYDITNEIGTIVANLVPVDGIKNQFIDLTYEIKDNEGTPVGTYTIPAGQTTGRWSTDNTEIKTGPNVGDYTYTITVTGQDQNKKQTNNKDSKECTATFTITKRDATFTGESDSLTWTGDEQTITDITAPTDLVPGHTYEGGLTYAATGTEPGTYNGKFTGSAIIKDAAGTDVTANYNVKTELGTLTITDSTSEVTVTFKIVGGKWSNGTTNPITESVQLTDGTGSLAGVEIPTGVADADHQGDGTWSPVTPEAETVITQDGDKVFTLTFQKKEEQKPADPVKLDVSRSKIASGLTKNSNGDWTTDVKLSLPSAEYEPVIDVVFILDDTHAGNEIFKNAATSLLTELSQKENVDVNVGIVNFDAVARDWVAATTNSQYSGLVSLKNTEGLTALQNAIATKLDKNNDGQTKKIGATNIEWPLEMAQDMLASGKGTEKYAILFSDMYGYVYRGDLIIDDQTYENVPLSKRLYTGESKFYQGSLSMGTKYQSFADVYAHRNDEENQTIDGFFRDSSWDSYWRIYSGYMQIPTNPATKDSADPFGVSGGYSGFEKSTCLVYDRLLQMKQAGINISIVNNDFAPGDIGEVGYVQSIKNDMLNTLKKEGISVIKTQENVTAEDMTNVFDTLKDQLIQVVSAGSTVTDKIGTNFDFVGLNTMSLKIGDDTIPGVIDEATNTITFKHADKNDAHVVAYDSDTNSFKWTINEDVTKDARVQLTYTVKLKTPQTLSGTYGVEDLNGDEKVDGTGAAVDKTKALYTNQEAKLVPKDSNGNTGVEQTFPMPSVSYTIKGSSGGHGGNGGGTVTIPDDVPTGLNGKDHYAYVVGYPDGMVYPQKNITRAEVATIFFRLLTDETREANMTKSNSYNDMKDGAWYTCAVSTLSKMGIIKGYEDGSFKPDASISRAEFAAIAARFDPDGDKTPATFSDVSSHWAKDEISIAANHGWIKGYEDGSFKPDQKITRAETMTLVNRVLKRLPETKDDLHKDMKTWPDNQNESAWFYLAVQEATNSHYQKLKKDGTHETWESMRETRDWAALEK